MGFRISYLLTQTDLETACLAFGLRETARSDEAPLGDADWWGAHLVKTGWTVIWAEGELFFFDRRKQVQAMSRAAPVISCIVNETMMASTAMGWVDGAERWSVHHQGDGKDKAHFETTGAPPPLFETLRDRAAAKDEDGVDYYFDVPIDLARVETGFRYDTVLPAGDTDGYVLLEQEPPLPGLLSRLLGRR